MRWIPKYLCIFDLPQIPRTHCMVLVLAACLAANPLSAAVTGQASELQVVMLNGDAAGKRFDDRAACFRVDWARTHRSSFWRSASEKPNYGDFWRTP